MWEEGAKLRAIAAEVGFSHTYVQKRAEKLGLPPKERTGEVAPSSAKPADSRFHPPAHLTAHKNARRGFVVPIEKEAEYIRLLKTGIPISEVRQKLGL
jgi:hypothetical protein